MKTDEGDEEQGEQGCGGEVKEQGENYVGRQKKKRYRKKRRQDGKQARGERQEG